MWNLIHKGDLLAAAPAALPPPVFLFQREEVDERETLMRQFDNETAGWLVVVLAN